MRAVRWLGAFGKANSLHESLNWELTQTERTELAAEPVDEQGSFIHSRVGLLVKRQAIVKVFQGDCWSVWEDGKLKKSRNPRNSSFHREAWVRPEYAAIVVKDWHNLSGQVRRTVAWFARTHSLTVIEFNTFKEVKLP